MTSFVVLWLFFSSPWVWHGLPMDPGWAAVAVLDPESCPEALTRVRQPAVCAPGEMALTPLAEIHRTERRASP